MTDLHLQDALIQELKELTASHSLKKLNGEVWENYHIYRQDKPYKDEEETEDQADYIIVMIDDEDTDKDGRWIVTIHMIFSIMLYDEENQGNLVLASLMNQVDLHLTKKGIIAGVYEMEEEKHKRFNQECYPNFYECDYITKWKLPEMNMEGIGDLI